VTQSNDQAHPKPLMEIHPDIIVGVEDDAGNTYLTIVITQDYRIQDSTVDFRAMREHWFENQGTSLATLFTKSTIILRVIQTGGEPNLQSWWNANGSSLTYRFRAPWKLADEQWVKPGTPTTPVHPQGSLKVGTQIDGVNVWLVLEQSNGNLSRAVWYTDPGKNPVVFPNPGNGDKLTYTAGAIPSTAYFFDEKIC